MKKESKLFRLFTPKSITKDDEFAEIPTNFKGFFVMFGRKFWNISNLSLVYSLVNLPVVFIFLAVAMRKSVTVAVSPMFSAYHGFSFVSESHALKSLYPFLSSFSDTSVFTTASYVCLAIACLFIFTFGLSNVGAAYIVRGYNRGDPIFLMTDFFSCIKRNWKQGLIIGILDIIISFLLIFDFMFWNGEAGFISGIMMYFSLFLCVLYFMMRFYIYTIAITFDLSIYKIFKDAFLLSFLGFKRNLLGLLGILAVVFLNMYICLLFVPVGVMLPIIITFGTVMFIAGYASFPVIQKYMIDPYYSDEKTDDDFSEDAPVFEDRG